MLEKMIWIKAHAGKKQDARKKIVRTALENNFINIVVQKDDITTFKKLGKLNLIHIDNAKFKINGKTGESISIKNKKDQEKALKLAGKVDYVLVIASNWKVIPVENLIAAFQKTKSKLLIEVNDSSEAKLFLETLEVGVDGVVLNATNFKKIYDLRKLVDKMVKKRIKLVSAKITQIKSLGMGDRVCIDTCSMLDIGEGMLIGSQANGLFLIHSESVDSEYVATRPFRVNAGPVHSYVLVPNDNTLYLSDIQVGSEVLAVDLNGNTRPVTIGRVKIERRPLILLEVKVQQKKFNIILQNAETIRLISGGKPVSIVDLAKGDSILVCMGESGRHFGMKVDETVIEK